MGQTVEVDKQAVVGIIQKAYLGAAFNDIDIDAVKSEFHENFIWQNVDHGGMTVTPLRQWVILLSREKWLRLDWNNRATAHIEVIGIESFLPKDCIFILKAKNTP